ncbi:hypothetical protein [Cohaesibacter celericrescens]|uniref:Uncharacterized protein n=1 Tax=Cohaesibacter celericrescens TaxID=2067669 RepID=A0A2N5XQ23_9HYPH|nr:hypothetical protein [Cohaesibacter celericrescens]PLW76612.1 hypothetical protein C0081_13755 [Cohaesibacter celericrescens]
MLKSVFLKEWLKIRWIWLLALIINLCALGYLLLTVRHQFKVEHSEMIWYWVFELRRLLFDAIKYVPLLTGAMIAVAQFLPEMISNRFRLSLHLPIRADVLVWSWVGFGALMGGLIMVVYAVGLYFIISGWFPEEAAVSAVLTAAPWLLAGWVAYFGVTLIMMEPHAPHKVFYMALSLAFIGLLYQEKGYQEYDEALPVLACMAALFVLTVILPAHRYRHHS